MANPDVDTINDSKELASRITNFLYKNGQGRNGVREDITKEEAIELLKEVEYELYNNWNSAAIYLGWIEYPYYSNWKPKEKLTPKDEIENINKQLEKLKNKGGFKSGKLRRKI